MTGSGFYQWLVPLNDQTVSLVIKTTKELVLIAVVDLIKRPHEQKCPQPAHLTLVNREQH